MNQDALPTSLPADRAPVEPRPAGRPAPAPFVRRRRFMMNAFERRFLGVLVRARQERSWHVVAAAPGSGKSMGIADLLRHTPARKGPTGRTRLPILATSAVQSGATSARDLGARLAAAFGAVPPTLTRDQRQSWLVQHCHATGVELLIVDDAHELTLDHLRYLKELTDLLAAPPYEQLVGLCLVSATSGGRLPLQEIFRRPELVWQQFHRRLDAELPYAMVLNHTEAEVAEICAGFEDLYREQFPALALVPFAATLYAWLTTPLFDPERTGRVTMDVLEKLIALALRTARAEGLPTATGELLHAAAEVLRASRHHTVAVDGEPADGLLGLIEVA